MNFLFRLLVKKAQTIEDIELLEAYQYLEAERMAKMEDMRVLRAVVVRWFLVLIFALIILAITAIYGVDASNPNAEVDASQVTENRPARFLVEGYNEYLWAWYDSLPYVVIEEMCWNETQGFGCDERLLQDGHVINRVTDYELSLHGHVYENDSGCWIWWWQRHHDTENNPHPILALWIECPELVVLEVRE
jgi:hypothetical protein